MKKAIRAAAGALALVAGAALALGDASAHGRRHHDGPPIVIVPPGHRAQPYPYWYYGRPEPRYYAPPVVVVPAPRYYYERPYRRHHRQPGVTFHFRF